MKKKKNAREADGSHFTILRNVCSFYYHHKKSFQFFIALEWESHLICYLFFFYSFYFYRYENKQDWNRIGYQAPSLFHAAIYSWMGHSNNEKRIFFQYTMQSAMMNEALMMAFWIALSNNKNSAAHALKERRKKCNAHILNFLLQWQRDDSGITSGSGRSVYSALIISYSDTHTIKSLTKKNHNNDDGGAQGNQCVPSSSAVKTIWMPHYHHPCIMFFSF